MCAAHANYYPDGRLIVPLCPACLVLFKKRDAALARLGASSSPANCEEDTVSRMDEHDAVVVPPSEVYRDEEERRKEGEHR